jgi:hypothetical protein
MANIISFSYSFHIFLKTHTYPLPPPNHDAFGQKKSPVLQQRILDINKKV